MSWVWVINTPWLTLEFARPWMLVALLIVPVVLWRGLRIAPPTLAFSRGDLIAKSRPGWRARLRHLPVIVRSLAIACLVIAGARPRALEDEQRTVEGIDIFVVLDMSGSMAAVDMSGAQIRNYQINYREEPPNRFQNAIATLKAFVAQRERDRIGMVVFARDAYLQFPLTLDYATIQTILDDLELNAIDPAATAIGNGLGIALRGLLESDARSKTVILITDGRQQGGNISPMQAAELARDENVTIYPILVGREGTSMTPSIRRRDGLMDYASQSYPIDPELLRNIAELTGGAFYWAEQPEQLERDLNAILDRLETSMMQDLSSVRRKELGANWVLPALLLLALEALLAFVLVRRFP
jgi:Ca-activated chloride channel family protein